MLDDLKGVKLCYSLGVGPDVSWDFEMAENGADIFQYDHTVDEAPTSHPRFHFNKIGIADTDDVQGLRRLDTLLQLNGHASETEMILKVDIEGHEWSCLDALAPSIFGQFRQIAIEFHWVDHLHDEQFRTLFSRVLQRIRLSHECIHIHANNYSNIVVTGGIPIAQVYEVTFVRRDQYYFTRSDEVFPGPLDVSNAADRPDYFLGRFEF
ncbi:FkbM family methyltransferase [Lichenihabitans sp. PAMC28606]|uniref:FkbM family methyltransferase n=1 Tax=Lichenihabitans sp. PAMC28606 TaxID=2880932 RepID=UPI001D0A14A0|nr:FkbM family methyltransferase [Lichenihabitans sp. PAMC28606]UDL93386.1 FkbM family methyltransferase [Lichenihabitans sp. PAMC28606]